MGRLVLLLIIEVIGLLLLVALNWRLILGINWFLEGVGLPLLDSLAKL
jgi:hypothetical protein